MLLSLCSVSHYQLTAGNLFARLAMTYSGGLFPKGNSVFFLKKFMVPNKMSEGERYIIAKAQILAKGCWYADQ